MTETAGLQFFQKVLPECNAHRQAVVVHSPTQTYRAITPTFSYEASGHKVFIIEIFERGCEPKYRPTPPAPIRIDLMQSPSSYTYSNARHCYRLSGGIAQARIAALHSIAVTRPILSRYPQIARSYRRMRPSFAASRSRRPLQSNLSKPEPAAKSP